MGVRGLDEGPFNDSRGLEEALQYTFFWRFEEPRVLRLRACGSGPTASGVILSGENRRTWYGGDGWGSISTPLHDDRLRVGITGPSHAHSMHTTCTTIFTVMLMINSASGDDRYTSIQE